MTEEHHPAPAGVTGRPQRRGRCVHARLAHTRPAADGSIWAHDHAGAAMTGADYVVLFVCVTITGFGIPGPGDASLLAAGTLAGKGRLDVGIVLVVSAVAWMAGSVIGYAVGHHGGRPLLDSPGWLQKRRRNLLAKGDHARPVRQASPANLMPRAGRRNSGSRPSVQRWWS